MLRTDPGLIPAALEEILRWSNPLHYFRRTATADTVLGSTQIKAGDAVAMYYTSVNRDEDVFDDGQDFDIRRTPNKHLSFGQAEHFCVGVHLARLEGRIELTGEPKRLLSNLNNSYKLMPVSLTA
jgi:cytochrome P450